MTDDIKGKPARLTNIKCSSLPTLKNSTTQWQRMPNKNSIIIRVQTRVHRLNPNPKGRLPKKSKKNKVLSTPQDSGDREAITYYFQMANFQMFLRAYLNLANKISKASSQNFQICSEPSQSAFSTLFFWLLTHLLYSYHHFSTLHWTRTCQRPSILPTNHRTKTTRTSNYYWINMMFMKTACLSFLFAASQCQGFSLSGTYSASLQSTSSSTFTGNSVRIHASTLTTQPHGQSREMTMYEPNPGFDPSRQNSAQKKLKSGFWVALDHTENWISQTLARSPKGNPHDRKEVSYDCELNQHALGVIAGIFRWVLECFFLLFFFETVQIWNWCVS